VEDEDTGGKEKREKKNRRKVGKGKEKVGRIWRLLNL